MDINLCRYITLYGQRSFAKEWNMLPLDINKLWGFQNKGEETVFS